MATFQIFFYTETCPLWDSSKRQLITKLNISKQHTSRRRWQLSCIYKIKQYVNTEVHYLAGLPTMATLWPNSRNLATLQTTWPPEKNYQRQARSEGVSILHCYHIFVRLGGCVYTALLPYLRQARRV